MAFNESQCISTSATDAGNITSRKEYARTNSEKGELLDTVVYTYGDSEWGDLLTAYDGKPITYDGIGNILTYDGWTFNWEHGRELASMSNGTTTWTYTYDANGMRTSRTNGTTTYNYVYNGSQLTQMTIGTDTLYFTYDASGLPATVTLNGTTYYYALNAQGDVIGIYTESGADVCSYVYDAWGKLVYYYDNTSYTIDNLNPLRYRGYVFDQDTGLYYLQSRYYNPEWGRFVNSDVVYDYDAGIQGFNLFVYCGNNPIRRIDISGADSEDTNLDITDDQISAKEGSSSGNSSGGGKAIISSGGTNGGGYSYTTPKGGGGVSSRTQVGNTTVTFGHGGRRLEGDISGLERTIAQDVVCANPPLHTYYCGNVSFNGVSYKYSGFRLTSTLINVGTYVDISKAD